MDRDDARKLVDAIYYGTRPAAQHMYEFIRPAYDEDAGVFTDYGQNDPSRTWANVHFQSLCANAVINVDWGKTDDGPVYVTLLEMSIGAVVQLLWALWSNDDLQKRVWKSAGFENWESDGHYGQQTREQFMAEEIQRYWIDRKCGIRISELLQATYGPNIQKLQGELILGRNPRDIRRQLGAQEV
jgi:hypothetical protein